MVSRCGNLLAVCIDSRGLISSSGRSFAIVVGPSRRFIWQQFYSFFSSRRRQYLAHESFFKAVVSALIYRVRDKAVCFYGNSIGYFIFEYNSSIFEFQNVTFKCICPQIAFWSRHNLTCSSKTNAQPVFGAFAKKCVQKARYELARLFVLVSHEKSTSGISQQALYLWMKVGRILTELGITLFLLTFAFRPVGQQHAYPMFI